MRKVFSPNDFTDLGELETKILAFQSLYEANAKPFTWKFSREDLKAFLAKLGDQQQPQKMAA